MRWGQRLWAEKAQQGRRPPHRPLVRARPPRRPAAGGARGRCEFFDNGAIRSEIWSKRGANKHTERGNPQFSLCLNFLWARWRGEGRLR